MITGKVFSEADVSSIFTAVPDIEHWIAVQLKVQICTEPPDVSGLRHKLDALLEDSECQKYVEKISQNYSVNETVLKYFLP